MINTEDLLYLIECPDCGHEHYFEVDNLPGGPEHCEHCEECGAMILTPDLAGLTTADEGNG